MNNRYLYCLFLLIATVSCQQQVWNEYYEASPEVVSGNIMEVLSNHSEYSTFVSLLEQTHGDSLLRYNQTFTVFAPTNEALKDFEADERSMDKFVKNQVARYLYGTGDVADTSDVRIKMLNGKYQELVRTADGMTFAGIPLDGKPIIVGNGIIYGMNAKAEYYDNLWELLSHGTGRYDSIYAYLSAFNDTTTSYSAIEVGENTRGQKLYYHNQWFKKYGSIHLEDSLYSAILPTNAGWADAYSRIAPYFRTFGSLLQDKTSTGTIIYKRTYELQSPLADSLQKAHTSEMIAHDILFRRRPDFYAPEGDSLVSTSGTVYHHPSYLIDGLERKTASNGCYHEAGTMRAKVSDAFLKPIRIEAEDASGRVMNYATLTKRSALDGPLSDVVSKSCFLEVLNTSTNLLMQPQVEFDIPDALAAEYDIYAVFVPALAFDTLATGYRQPDTIICQRDTVINRVHYQAGDQAIINYPYYNADSTKVCFYLNYVHEQANGSGYNMYEDSKIEKDPDTGDYFITKGYSVTRFLVARAHSFPYANYTSSAFSGDDRQTVNTKIRVVTNLKAADKKTLGYTMRLDYIELVPVTE